MKKEIKGLVSVIIPNHNRDISRLIKSLKESTYKNIEILEINLGYERSKQRNIGIDKARGEYFLFLDSDHEVSPYLIKDCVKKLNLFYYYNSVFLPEVIVAAGLFGKIRDWERWFYNNTLIDAVRFVRAKYCPYFDESLNGPEDSDWDRRIPGEKIASDYPLYHNDNISFLAYLRKKAYYSESMNKFANKWKGDKILDWEWRCFGVFLEEGKWKRFFSRPDLALAVLFIIFLRGIIYKWKTRLL